MRTFIALSLLGWTCFAADWSPQKAADYLDRRQKEWAAWPPAATSNGACFSCHTGMTYMLARPALRKVLGEKQPTQWETAILKKMATDAGKEPAGQLRMVNTLYEALFLREGNVINEARRRALDQMWSLQYKDGNFNGGWAWYNAGLEPWEGPSSFYFGSTMAAQAVGRTPSEYQSGQEVRERIEAMKAYLLKGLDARPLHNRVELLWASASLAGLIDTSQRKAIIDEVSAKQGADGSWTLAAIGPWPEHKGGADLDQPSAYATAFTAYVLLQTGEHPSGGSLKKALDWLREHQDAESGAWKAVSINKPRPAESMEAHFLQDGATGFAAAALAEAQTNQ